MPGAGADSSPAQVPYRAKRLGVNSNGASCRPLLGGIGKTFQDWSDGQANREDPVSRCRQRETPA